MTPHSDEQVLCLSKGLQARERTAMKRLIAAADVMAHDPDHTADRVVVFKNSRPANSVRRVAPADIISLDVGRTQRAERNTGQSRLDCLPETIA
ncbi:MAG: hypothetical protein HKP54_11255 [Boseongicola sp.]|nr:hypothetical protein [Boseongicola sp.]